MLWNASKLLDIYSRQEASVPVISRPDMTGKLITVVATHQGELRRRMYTVVCS